MNQTSLPVREHWRQVIQRQQSSGLSVARFCREQQIAESSLFAWKRRLACEPVATAAPIFLPVKLAAISQAGDAMAPSPGAIELHVGQGRHLVLRPGFDAPTLAAVLAVLTGGTCTPEQR